jgi:methylmalonyl-CoA/ethylmalonyl-CoA epimerase
MIKKLLHIGVAVRELDTSIELFSKLFGIGDPVKESVADQKVNVAFFHVGNVSVELTEATSPDSAIAKFIDKRGEGVHHLSFEVDDIDQELRRLKDAGFQLVDDRPRPGADGCRVAFLHPKSTNGILIELSQKVM